MAFFANEPLTRRRLLAVLAASSPMLVAQRRQAVRATKRIDRTTLAAVAEVVLPTALGASGVTAAVSGFERWLVGYRGGAELLHGYGAGEIRHTPPSPAPRFEADLKALDRAAHEQHGRGFAALNAENRLALIVRTVGPVASAEIPAIAQAKHVAIALVAHWAASTAGFDAAYGAKIGRFGCRPLAANPDRPPRFGAAS